MAGELEAERPVHLLAPPDSQGPRHGWSGRARREMSSVSQPASWGGYRDHLLLQFSSSWE